MARSTMKGGLWKEKASLTSGACSGFVSKPVSFLLTWRAMKAQRPTCLIHGDETCMTGAKMCKMIRYEFHLPEYGGKSNENKPINWQAVELYWHFLQDIICQLNSSYNECIKTASVDVTRLKTMTPKDFGCPSFFVFYYLQRRLFLLV